MQLESGKTRIWTKPVLFDSWVCFLDHLLPCFLVTNSIQVHVFIGWAYSCRLGIACFLWYTATFQMRIKPIIDQILCDFSTAKPLSLHKLLSLAATEISPSLQPPYRETSPWNPWSLGCRCLVMLRFPLTHSCDSSSLFVFRDCGQKIQSGVFFIFL